MSTPRGLRLRDEYVGVVPSSGRVSRPARPDLVRAGGTKNGTTSGRVPRPTRPGSPALTEGGTGRGRLHEEAKGRMIRAGPACLRVPARREDGNLTRFQSRTEWDGRRLRAIRPAGSAENGPANLPSGEAARCKAAAGSRCHPENGTERRERDVTRPDQPRPASLRRPTER